MLEARICRRTLRKCLFFRWSKRSEISGQEWQAWKSSLISDLICFEPATRAATFCSSFTFQLTNCSMSGWSTSRQTILAARRVVPPDLIEPAAVSPIFRKDIRPEETPPPDNGSLPPRRSEKLDPVPEPYLNKRASRTQRSIIPPSWTRSSLTDWMKQACGWG